MRFFLFIRWIFRVLKVFLATRKNFNLDFGIVSATGKRNLLKFSFGMVVAIVSYDYLGTASEPESSEVKDRLDKFAIATFKAFYKQKES